MKTFLLPLFLFVSALCYSQLDEKFYQPGKTMKPITAVSYTEFSLPVEKDTITGIIMNPKNQAKATVLFFHGSGGNVSTYTFMTQPLVEAGYRVLMVDFRGYGKSTGAPTHQNIQHDGQKFLDYVLNMKELAGTKVILYGASMGSLIATNLAKNNGNSVHALVLDGTISSLNDVAIHFAPQQEALLKTIPFPYAAKEDIKGVKIPTLFIHSEKDTMIPLKQGTLVYDNAPGPKVFLKYDGAHLEAMVHNKAEVIRNIDALLQLSK